MFNIEILKVTVTPQGKFRVAVVDHKTSDGKVDSKRLVSFGAGKPAFDVLSQAQQGDVFEIESKKVKNEKDGKEYWTWVAASSAGKANGTSAAKTTSSVVRASYETPTERAARQVYIVRQSSIANAIAFQNGTKRTVEDILNIARQFEGYVFGADSLIKDELLPSEVE